MFEPARHAPLRQTAWSAEAAQAAIDDIVADALQHFDADGFWPAHPMDDGVANGHAGFYFGATGVIWALEYLRRVGATGRAIDFRPFVPHLVETAEAEFVTKNYGKYAAHGSFLFGDLGAALLAMRLAPDLATAGRIAKRVEANDRLPVRELMWGTPGSMLACVHMDAMTHEPRWRALFLAQAARMLGELKETKTGPLWIQDLYGEKAKWIGPIHGYAGNMIPLLRGWAWLSDSQRDQIADAIPRTLSRNVRESALGATWGSKAGEKRPRLCQHCHGAPGMVTTFADAPFSTPELERLLVRGADLTWAAGPLAKGSNLCHGTGGNGYAFLKLYGRTGDAMWLDRARAFAMTAMAQCREARAELGRGRFSLWTGDVGLAVYLWDCLTAKPAFPTIDVF